MSNCLKLDRASALCPTSLVNFSQASIGARVLLWDTTRNHSGIPGERLSVLQMFGLQCLKNIGRIKCTRPRNHLDFCGWKRCWSYSSSGSFISDIASSFPGYISRVHVLSRCVSQKLLVPFWRCAANVGVDVNKIEGNKLDSSLSFVFASNIINFLNLLHVFLTGKRSFPSEYYVTLASSCRAGTSPPNNLLRNNCWCLFRSFLWKVTNCSPQWDVNNTEMPFVWKLVQKLPHAVAGKSEL